MVDEKRNQTEPLPDISSKKDMEGKVFEKTYVENAHASGDGSLKRSDEEAEKVSGKVIEDDKEKY